MNKELKKELNAIIKSDVQKDAVGHYGEFYLKDIEELLASQRKEIIENIEDVRNRVFEHRGENKQLDESMNGLAGVIFNEIINLIKNERH